MSGPSPIERARIWLTGDHDAEKATPTQLALTKNQPRRLTDAEIEEATR